MSDSQKAADGKNEGNLADALATVFNGAEGWREKVGLGLRPCAVCGLTHVSQSLTFPIEWHHADEDLSTSSGKPVGRGVVGLSSPTEPGAGSPLREVR